jgi:hypothetical protein
MQAESVALADTIKILNDDDALELFKKALPSPAAAAASSASFLQVRQNRDDDGNSKHRRQKAAKALKKRARGDPRMSFVIMALKGSKQGFEAVTKKVDALIQEIAQEQKDDDQKKDFCNREIDKTEDELKDNQRAIKDRGTIIAETSDTVKAITEEVAKFVADIKTLDAEVAEQTALRKEKASAVRDTVAQNNAAKELLKVAKERLNKFYNPSFLAEGHKAKKHHHRSEEEDDASDDSGKGAALDRPKSPQAMLETKTNSGGSGTVISMLDTIIGDVDIESAELQAQDADAQKDYEMFIKDSAEKRTVDSNAMADKQGAKSLLEDSLEKDTEALRSEKTDESQTAAELKGLHKDCDWLLQNFDARKKAREDESDSLEKAKAVLAGADFE